MMSSKKWIVIIIVMTMLFIGTNATLAADEVDARIEKLETALAKTQAQLAQLQSQQGKTAAYQNQMKAILDKSSADAGTDVPDWVSNLSNLKADFRYRYRWTDDDSSADESNINHLRARVSFYGKVNDEMDLVFRLGGAKTMEQTGGSPDAYMDVAYIDYHPGENTSKIPLLGVGIDILDNVMPFWNLNSPGGLHILAGKFGEPYYHPGNVNLPFWDSGNFEGVAGLINQKIDDNLTLFSTVGGYWIDQREGADVGTHYTNQTTSDTSLWGVQFGSTLQLPDVQKGAYVTSAVTYYNYGGMQGNPALGDDFDHGNNSSIAFDPDAIADSGDESSYYTSDYDILDVSAETGLEVCGLPVTLFGEWVKNTNCSTDGSSGYAVGVGVAEHAALSNVRFFYNYCEMGTNAVVQDYTYNNWGGNTNGRGHKVTAGYKLMENCSFDVSWEFGDRMVSGMAGDVNYNRVTADLTAKF